MPIQQNRLPTNRELAERIVDDEIFNGECTEDLREQQIERVLRWLENNDIKIVRDA